MKKLISILTASMMVFFLAGCTKDCESDVIRNYNIGGLFSITGNWSSLGIPSQEAMRLGLIDVNAYLEDRGSNVRFTTTLSDTQLDTSLAKSAIERAFTEYGIRFIIGPQSSAELAAIKDYANANKILVVSQGSTASSLAIANDAIFRFCPGDGVEGNAMAQTMFASGKSVVISLARNDAGNRGLQQSVGNAFAAFGGQVEALNSYSTTNTDFSVVLAQLKAKILQYTSTVGSDGIAVYLASFDEAKILFEQASTDPIFSTVKWYGGDGIVLSNVLLSSNIACAFAASTQFFAPNFGLPLTPNPQLANIAASINTNTGIEPDAYALSVYDIMWVLAKTIANHPNSMDDFSKLKTAFVSEANQHYGITGPVVLNANGDRSTGSFDYYGIVLEAGTYRWKLVGKSL